MVFSSLLFLWIFLPIEPLFSWNGYDLANMMGMTNVLTEDVNYIITGYSDADVTYVRDVPNDREAFTTFCRSYSNATDTRKVIFCRDSFGTGMMPFLASQFQEVYSPYISYFTREQVEDENPDVFILEVVERSGINHLLIQNWSE